MVPGLSYDQEEARERSAQAVNAMGKKNTVLLNNVGDHDYVAMLALG